MTTSVANGPVQIEWLNNAEKRFSCSLFSKRRDSELPECKTPSSFVGKTFVQSGGEAAWTNPSVAEHVMDIERCKFFGVIHWGEVHRCDFELGSAARKLAL